MDHHKYVGLSQALFEESNEARFLLDSSMAQILEVNAAGQRLCGFAIRDLIGASAADFFSYQGRPGFGPLIGNGRRANRFDMGQCELRTFQPDVRLHVDVSITRLCVKPEFLYLVRVRDVAATATQIKKDATLFRRLLSAAPVCLWTGEIGPDRDFRLEYLSPIIADIAGHSADFFIANFVNWDQIMHPADRMIRIQQLRQWSSGKSTDVDFQIIRHDGSACRLRECVRAEPSYRAECFRLFGAISDVTRLVPNI